MESSQPKTPETPAATAAPPGGQSPADAHAAASDDPFATRPELYVGGAFVGGLVIAQILRRLGR
jgi:hypothetical protein